MLPLQHLTLSTGHLRASPRHEVIPEAIAALQPLANAPAKTKVPVPGMPMLWMMREAVTPGSTVVTIGEQDGPAVVVMGVAWAQPHADTLWSRLVTLARESARVDGTLIAPVLTQPSTPWCAAILGVPSSLIEPGIIAAIGDLERCIAWTLIEHQP